jgi:hypothetical protein
MGMVFSIHAGGIVLKEGNFLLGAENLVVQVDRNGDADGGLFLPFNWVVGAALDPAGNIVVASGGYDPPLRIYRLNTNGVFLSTNVPPVIFDSFAIAPNGDFLLGEETTVFRVDPAMDFVDVFPILPAPGTAPFLTGISVDANGEIWTATWYNNSRTSMIHRLDVEGKLLNTLGPFDYQIKGVTADSNGHVFLGRDNRDDSGFPRPTDIVELDENGTQIRTFQAPVQISSMTLIRLPRQPTLTIDRDLGDVILSWPADAVGFELEAASITTPLIWEVLGITPIIVDGQFKAKVPGTSSGMVFRLRKSL